MRKTLIIVVLCFCFCRGLACADDASSNTTGLHPIAGIIHTIERLDAWIQRNLW